MLRKALEDTLKDKDFLAETEKAKLDLNPVSGEELETAVGEIFKMEPSMLPKLNDILFK